MKSPSLDIDFYSDEVILDPYPVYEKMRELGPVVYLPKHDMYALPRYKEVSEVLRQPLRFVSSRGVSPIQKVNDILVGSTLNSDPPEHDKTRAVTSEPLLPGALKEIEPLLVSSANGLIDTLCQRGAFDAISDFAQFLPVTIVAELVGLPVDSDQMLKWASATFNLFGTENARTSQAFEDLVDLRDFLQEYGRPEKLKDGGWAKRIFEVGPERGISYETCAQLMRDYINPSLDTTISTTGQIVKFFADHPDQWDLIRQDASLIPNAVEEAVRMATPIRAFTRYAIEDSDIAGHTIPAGKRVIVMYASANRDPRKFADPDRFDVNRDVHDHLGFGQGVHMCMGMHLARREIILLLEALRRRVEKFELLGEPVVAMNNTIRAYASMPIKVHLAADVLVDTPKGAEQDDPWLDVTVQNRTDVATDIIGLELASTHGTALPSYEAGAHVDVYVKSGLIRQYSLTGDPADSSKYRLGILLDPKSRGGSTAIHTGFETGAQIKIGRPRNNFPMGANVAHTILFAGGIGVTPMLNMAYALQASGASWEMHYCGRTADRLAFRDELERFGDKVQVHIDSGTDNQKLDINAVLANAASDKHLYVCGPNGFMDFIVKSAENNAWDESCVHLERFGAEVNTDGAPFTIVAQKSGKSFEVLPGETISQKLEENGIHVQVSCQSGVCGTCLTRVSEGMPDHRDLVQTDLEKASNAQITVCCSRSKTKKLVLDL
ncbi:MAG: cytochrome P450/oxidoreductase [Amylibacter sp.]|jgi:cytochrome P450/ferredoxin-NADP reductase|nr:cytochrome P450/oxidoreductase [Amylibacter sp.]